VRLDPCCRRHAGSSGRFADAAAAHERFTALDKAFRGAYDCAPTLFARAPGRVNLIGEHIDYEGYGVLPMAVTLDAVVAVARGGKGLHVRNVRSDAYPATVFESTSPAQAVDTHNHAWANYFLCAYKGVAAHLEKHGLSMPVTGLRVRLGS